MHVHISLFLHFFRTKNVHFFVSLYKELLEPTQETFLVCLIVLDHLSEVFGCTVIVDFISAMFRFPKFFGCGVIIFDCFTNFVFFFLIMTDSVL